MRPGFIHGTRRVGSMKLPLGLIGSPLEMVRLHFCSYLSLSLSTFFIPLKPCPIDDMQVLQHTKALNQIPLIGPLLTPPVSVNAVAKVAVRAAIDPVFPPGIIDVYGILRYGQQQR